MSVVVAFQIVNGVVSMASVISLKTLRLFISIIQSFHRTPFQNNLETPFFPFD